MSEDLMPCPFCGSSLVGPLTWSYRPGDKPGVVGCGVCGCSGPSLFDGADELASRWNQRARHDAPAVPVKRFDDAWCERCLKETTHLTYRATYECDGPDDWRECCDCRWRWRAAVGRYEAPTLEDMT